MQLLGVVHIINATKLYYLNLLRRLVLRLLLVDLDRGSNFSSELIPTPPTPNVRLPNYLTTYFFRGLFDLDLGTYFLFFRGG
jgi:hypothetical protein